MLRTILFTTIIGIVFFTAEYFGFGTIFPKEKWFILAFFFSLSALQHRVLSFGFQDDNDKFVQFYLASAVLKLILCIVFVAVFVYLQVSEVVSFIITFFALYLFYTCFEVVGMYRNLRRDLKP